MSEHLSQDRLLELAYGELPPEEAAACEAHALGCAQCTKPLEDIRSVRRMMAAMPVEQPPASAEASLLAFAQQAVRRQPGRKQGAGWSRWFTPLASVLALSLIAVVGVRVAREGTPETLAARHPSSEVQWAAAPVAAVAPVAADGAGDRAKAGEGAAALAGPSSTAAPAKSVRFQRANRPEPMTGGAAPTLAASPAAARKRQGALEREEDVDDRLEKRSVFPAEENKIARKDTPPSPAQRAKVSGSAVADKEPAPSPATPAAAPPSSAMEAQTGGAPLLRAEGRGTVGSITSPSGNAEKARERPSLDQVRAALVEARGPAREPLLHRLCVEEQRADHEAEALGACRTLLVEFPRSRWAPGAQRRLEAARARLSPQP